MPRVSVTQIRVEERPHEPVHGESDPFCFDVKPLYAMGGKYFDDVERQGRLRSGAVYAGLRITWQTLCKRPARNFFCRKTLPGEHQPSEADGAPGLVVAARIAREGGGTIMWGHGGSYHGWPLFAQIIVPVEADYREELLRNPGESASRALFASYLNAASAYPSRHPREWAASGVVSVRTSSFRPHLPHFVIELTGDAS